MTLTTRDHLNGFRIDWTHNPWGDSLPAGADDYVINRERVAQINNWIDFFVEFKDTEPAMVEAAEILTRFRDVFFPGELVQIDVDSAGNPIWGHV